MFLIFYKALFWPCNPSPGFAFHRCFCSLCMLKNNYCIFFLINKLKFTMCRIAGFIVNGTKFECDVVFCDVSREGPIWLFINILLQFRATVPSSHQIGRFSWFKISCRNKGCSTPTASTSSAKNTLSRIPQAHSSNKLVVSRFCSYSPSHIWNETIGTTTTTATTTIRTHIHLHCVWLIFYHENFKYIWA